MCYVLWIAVSGQSNLVVTGILALFVTLLLQQRPPLPCRSPKAAIRTRFLALDRYPRRVVPGIMARVDQSLLMKWTETLYGISILYSRFGSGHLSASKALAAALRAGDANMSWSSGTSSTRVGSTLRSNRVEASTSG